MRLKNVPGAREEIERSAWAVTEPESYRGRWQNLFEKEQPLAAEIGMGKGRFLMEMAQRDPGTNFLGLEKYSSVLLRAVQKQEERQLANLRLIRADAQYLKDFFAPGELSVIYLNFSDPWPKDRHAHRRLTSPRFLERYREVLAPGGRVEFKTDNAALFDYSLESLEQERWQILSVTRDLHHSDQEEGNVMTEYEERFSALGNPICRLTAVPPLDK